MENIKETPKALVDPVAEGSTEQAVANAQVADDEKLSSQSSNNDEGNPSVESEASRRIEETPNLLSYEVFQYGDSIEDIDLGELPKDMSDPESWEKIAQICKDKEVDIVCYLDKPYKDCSIAVFRSSGNYLFIGKWVQKEAYYGFAKSDEVKAFSADLFGHTQRFYYVWDDWGWGVTCYLLYNEDKNDTTENRVLSSDSFGPITSMLLDSSFKMEMI